MSKPPVFRGSPFPFLNGMPNYPLSPYATAKHTPTASAVRAPAPQRQTGPLVVVSGPRHACLARTTPANIADWVVRATRLRPATSYAFNLYPSAKYWDGVPLLLHFGLESGWNVNAVSGPETKAKSISSRPSRSWGIGQVIDVNFPRIFQTRAPRDDTMVAPPTMDQASIQGADLSRAGRSLSGLHYAASWLANAAKAYANSKSDPANWKLLAYAGRDVPEVLHRAVFLRLWAGGSSQASLERRVPGSYFGIKACAERVLSSVPSNSSWL